MQPCGQPPALPSRQPHALAPPLAPLACPLCDLNDALSEDNVIAAADARRRMLDITAERRQVNAVFTERAEECLPQVKKT